MSLKHYILGWIAAAPIHGYELKKRYQQFIDPSGSLNDAKLYPLLRDLERDGLIEKRLQHSESGPARKVLHVTPKGRREFRAWLESPAGEDYDGRPLYDFFRAFPLLTKFPFFARLKPDQVVAKLAAQRALHEGRIAEFRQARVKMLEKGLEAPKLQTIDFGIRLEQAKLDWIERMIVDYGGTRRTARRTRERKT